MKAEKPSVLLAGCGDIACRLANLLDDRFDMTGLRRQPGSLPPHIRPLAADLCDAEAVAMALAGLRFDYVIITLTPGERCEQRYRQVYVEGTRHLLMALQGSPRLLFVSSTSVYAQDDGEIVDESSPAKGSGFSGQCLREAESLVSGSGFSASNVRFSGIYGPGRERLLRMVREGRVDSRAAAHWTNRIHADDCARVLAFLIERWQSGIAPRDCYVASDACPVQSGTVWQWLAAEAGVTDPLAGLAWQQQESKGKRCDSHQLRSDGFRFLYPDYQSGYRALLGSQ